MVIIDLSKSHMIPPSSLHDYCRAPSFSRSASASQLSRWRCGVVLVASLVVAAINATTFHAVASASTSIALGRANLELQTPTGLQTASTHFQNAINADSNNLEANLLRAATLLALEQGSPDFQQQLTSIGITITNPNIYDFEYQVPVDTEAHIKPTTGVSSVSTISYLNSKESLIDAALSCLDKFGNDSASRSFRIRLTAAETSLVDVRVDYGDVLILRSFLKASKAAIALANSYHIAAEYALFYRLFKQGELTPQKVLAELPDLLKFSDRNRRASGISWLVAANRDYQAGYAFTKGPRLPPGNTPYLFEFAEPKVADSFAAELSIIIGDLSAGSDTYLYNSFYPWFVRGLTVDTAALLSSSAPPRDFMASQFTQGFPTRTSWPDESFGGVLPEPYSRSVLLDEFDLIMGQLVDVDGDGLSDSWERGYGRYEIVNGQFISDWAGSDAAARGGHLATFTSQEEWDRFWFRHWRDVTRPLYLGLVSDGTQPAVWNWNTGESGSFRDWLPGEPVDNGVNITAVVDPTLQWRSLKEFMGFYWDPSTWTYVSDFPEENIGYILERGYPTDPTKADTDQDGFNDRVETIIGSDPNNPASFPSGPDMDGDGVNNYREAFDRTNPLDPASLSPLSLGLVAHYPFSNSAKDESGFDRDGTVFGAILGEDRFGLASRAYSFDGASSFISTPATVSQYGSAATFAAWVKVPMSGAYLGAVVSQPKDSSTTGLRLAMQNGQPEASISNPYFYQGYYWWGAPNYSVISPTSFSGGPWRHIVAVSEGWATRLYIDGQEVAATYAWTGGQSSSQTILIGKEFENPMMPWASNVFQGQIDEVRVYDRALSGAEVGDLFANESAALLDTDGDGLPDVVETDTGVFLSGSDTGTSPTDADTDGDGLLDGVESNSGLFVGPIDYGSNPLKADTNGDGIKDGEAVDGGFGPLADLTPTVNWFKTLIQAQPGRFGLMTSDAIMDLNIGNLLIQRVGQSAVLNMQIETTSDITTQPFTATGSPISHSVVMPGNKGFLRVRVSGGSSAPAPTPAP